MKYVLQKGAVSLAMSLLVFLAIPSQALAQRFFDPSKGETGSQGGTAPTRSDDIPTIKGVEVIFENIVNVALAFSAIALFVMFLIAGFRYMTAGGDAKAMEQAKGTLTHAILGLVVLVLAYIVIQFIEFFTGISITTFTIYRR